MRRLLDWVQKAKGPDARVQEFVELPQSYINMQVSALWPMQDTAIVMLRRTGSVLMLTRPSLLQPCCAVCTCECSCL
jgi:hypothetical protein